MIMFMERKSNIDFAYETWDSIWNRPEIDFFSKISPKWNCWSEFFEENKTFYEISLYFLRFGIFRFFKKVFIFIGKFVKIKHINLSLQFIGDILFLWLKHVCFKDIFKVQNGCWRYHCWDFWIDSTFLKDNLKKS